AIAARLDARNVERGDACSIGILEEAIFHSEPRQLSWFATMHRDEGPECASRSVGAGIEGVGETVRRLRRPLTVETEMADLHVRGADIQDGKSFDPPFDGQFQ